MRAGLCLGTTCDMGHTWGQEHWSEQSRSAEASKRNRGVISRETSSSSWKVFDQSQHKLMFLSPFIEFFPLKFDGFSDSGDKVVGQCGEL